MSRWITWVSNEGFTGWTCSECGWDYAIPSLLSDPQAKAAFDRLASAKFRAHTCSDHSPRLTPLQDSFAERARKLVIRGFKPKDAADITLDEIIFEHRNDPQVAEKARKDAEDFLIRVKGGLI
ncbi:MAG TPA: hypothetical protein VLW84_00525 [Terriglobales bacterium]|nr:hypothetical protein [Terriglobales bacterium]